MKTRLTSRLLAAFLAAATVMSSIPAAGIASAETISGIDTSNIQDYTAYVDPFIGTDYDGGQLFPGAVSPSSLVKLSPETSDSASGTHNQEHHGGYDYSSKYMIGFSHTRVEGVGGIGSGGDVLVTPSYVNVTSRPTGLRKAQTFSHDTEVAEPGYYSVELDAKNAQGRQDESMGKIKAELTATTNVGYHKYTFPTAGEANLFVDLGYGYDPNTNGASNGNRKTTLNVSNVDGKTVLSGSIKAKTVGGHADYYLFYYAETDKELISRQTWKDSRLGDNTSLSGSALGTVLKFNVEQGEQVELKVAVSSISEAQAKRDLEAQVGEKSFETVRSETKAKWNDILGRVTIKTAAREADDMKLDELYTKYYTGSAASENKSDIDTVNNHVYYQSTIDSQADITEAEEDARLVKLFYTHLYHMFTTPVNATSSDGTFKVSQSTTLEADDFTYYDSWSLWDDFRKYPVLGIVAPEIYKDQIRSIAYLAQYGVGNLYSSSLSTNTVPTVRAEHAVALVADGIAKGFTDMDNLDSAYERFKSESTRFWDGEHNADVLGYRPNELDLTVENSYDDWAISFIAKTLGEEEDYETYSKRATNYRNLYRENAVTKGSDSIGMLWPKNADGSWWGNINEAENQGAMNLYQGTVWQYSLWDSYDISGLMELMGGKDKFLTYLEYLFGMKETSTDRYAIQRAMLHTNSNEIDLQTPYMFNVAGKPSYTQKWVRDIYTKATFNRYSGTGLANTHETNKGLPVYAYKDNPFAFLETMDDDCGTMAGNFVSAAMGLYPMTPGDTTYQIGSPFFEEMTIDLGNGQTFTIKANDVSSENFYIQSASLNGESFDRSWIDYSEIMRGGVLEFRMGSEPSSWAEDGQSVPSVDDLNGGTVADYLGLPSLSYSAKRVYEDKASDNGTINDVITITAKNGAQFASAGEELIASGKAGVLNLPEGLTAKITVKSADSAEISFEGRAVNHSSDIDDMIISFKDEAFSGMKACDVVDSTVGGLNAVIIDFYQNQKLKLDSYIAELEKIDGSLYTSATYGDLQSAVAEAKRVSEDASSTDENYSQQYIKLMTAYQSLKIKSKAYDLLNAAEADVKNNAANITTTNSLLMKNDSYVTFSALDFGSNGAASVNIVYEKPSVADVISDGYLEIRAGGASGRLIASKALPFTGTSWMSSSSGTAGKMSVYFNDPSVLTGETDITLVFKGTAAGTAVARLHSVQFAEAATSGRIEMEDYTSWSNDAGLTNPHKSDDNILKTEGSGSRTNIGGTFDGAWLRFSDINFGGSGLDKISVSAAYNTGRCGTDSRLLFWADAVSEQEGGTLLATLNLQTCSSWDEYKTSETNEIAKLTGRHDLYIVMASECSGSNPFVANLDYFEITPKADKSALEAAVNDTLSAGDYTDASFAAYSKAVAEAKEVISDADATPEQVSYALSALNEAKAGLKTGVKSIAVTSSLSLKVGGTAQLSAVASPANAYDKSVVFTSSNSAAVSVSSSGAVKAVAPGTAVITVQSVSNASVKASCTVTVSAADPANGVQNGVLYVNGKAVTGSRVQKAGSVTYAVVNGRVATGSKTRVVTVGSYKYIVTKNGTVTMPKKRSVKTVSGKSYVVGTNGRIMLSKKSNKLYKVGTKAYVVKKRTGVIIKSKKGNMLAKAGNKWYVVKKKTGAVIKGKKAMTAKVGKKTYVLKKRTGLVMRSTKKALKATVKGKRYTIAKRTGAARLAK